VDAHPDRRAAPRNVPCVLIVRDGWGMNPHAEQRGGDATRAARTPVNDALRRDWPHVLVKTSGEDVGLPVEHG
jgi:2,3-bisphosphoglycerate-independent phosphoglycerate mutase